jgi:hypothetical protein
MSSQLPAIYATIAAQEITVSGKTVRCYDLAALRTNIESVQLPARQLIPFNARGDGSLQSFWTPGQMGVTTVDWGIADMLFWRPVGAGKGLHDVAPELIAYKVQYLDLIKKLRGLGQQKINVINCAMTVQAFNWPLDSDRWWDGVICQLVIREIV